MHVQGGRAAVLLVTVGAALHVLVRLVGLPVSRQVAAAAVALAAVRTREAGRRPRRRRRRLRVRLAAAALAAVRAHAVAADVDVGREVCLLLLLLRDPGGGNRLIGEVVQSRRRPLLGPSPG